MSTSHTVEPTTERTLRNPRRRQRSDGDSLKTAPRRKRSKLSENTFATRDATEETEELHPTAHDAAMNGHTQSTTTSRKPPPRASRHESTEPMDLPMRGGRKPGTATLKHRPLKSDGATVLAQNAVYSVKLLPSTPQELRKEGVEYRGRVLSSSPTTGGSGHGQHLALAVTREKAWVWEYNAPTSASHTARVFDMPFPVRQSEEVPFGVLVPGVGSSAAASDVGLVLVSAGSGKVVYHESIERAASLGLFQERKTGVEGTIGGLASGERVVDVVAAEHAGFILCLSSGRVMQLTLRDAQGKAKIFTQVLRSGDGNDGFLGSLKGWYSGAGKRDVVAVRTRALDTRGQMQALSLTDRCELQTWDLDWSGRYEFRGTRDLRERLVDELKSLDTPKAQGAVDNLVALNFLIADKSVGSTNGNEVTTLGAEHPVQIWMLLRTGAPELPDYHLAYLSFSGSSIYVERVLSLESYHGRSIAKQPRLLLPKPGHTAYVVFGDAIVLAATSVPNVLDDPNWQLHEASYVQPQAFEDATYLQAEKGFVVLDSAAEDMRSGHSSSVAFVKGAGLVRVTVADPTGDVERTSIPIKSKVEQAVFYGAMQDNILDFTRKGDNQYSGQQFEDAALTISDEIMRSDTSFISSSPSSMETHLEYRARALSALVTHVRQNYPALSRAAFWQLLWDAEKVAAAQQMWKVFEAHRTSAEAADKEKRVATIVDELVAQLDNRIKLAGAESSSSDDLVRSFFLRGLAHIDFLLSNIGELLKTLGSGVGGPNDKTVRYIAEADELWARAMEAVFTFRAENAHLYGIDPELFKDGVLSDVVEYTDLPEFWTSTNLMLKASADIPKQSRRFAKMFYEREVSSGKTAAVEKVEHIALANPGLIQICCQVYEERINWLASRATAQDQERARQMRQTYEQDRYEQFRALASIGVAEQGMLLAEKYRDMLTLTELVVGESQYYVEELRSNKNMSPEERDVALAMMQQVTERIGRYFDKFGDDWANAFFDQAFAGNRAGYMLEEAQKHWKQALTRYLRAEPNRRAKTRICWINDITAEGDYLHAGEALCEAAVETETRVWGKKVELGMGRLALLAAQEDGSEVKPAPGLEELVLKPGRELKVLEVQEKLHGHVRVECVGALDRDAELQLAMDTFGKKVGEYGALGQLLTVNLDQLLSHQVLSVEELIEVLTLMDCHTYEDRIERPEANLQGTEFAQALYALDAAAPGMPQARFETLLQLIWKRCYIFDDWSALTKASAEKSSTEPSVLSLLRDTAPWHTYFDLHDSGLLTRPDCRIRVLEPSECLDAACRPEDLAYRFPNRDLLDPILQDNQVQDEVLQGYVADRALDDWAKSCLDAAKWAVENKAERVASWRGKERETQANLETREMRAGRGKGAGKANGHVNGVGKGVNGVLDGDGDVDVEME
ncbi:hypothetical protein LTR91_013743 [Friedmanniomyces endolithicus]|uniref:Nucleoporin Nup133/Nup155-like C-terminal domain-containing protein n=1 Tax=Friedmanniomyces endolithicus TaxID=329885 RepID=A0AAN6KDA1_9PEZI|nr:hypothetical protein LTR03_000116 [Friedmanniomyces endolithicus]KAK0917546.1 hypothetical protein LTR57_012501 [Friedmanniomyces endolithicus]KAK0971876.1 hypothetical protein LTS01_015146 [Friedmanniomyces endolithicus]KAK0976277.1 hypothetical protein LTR91_013743 [Friedmanniomyces endolithicus]KAK1042617.1 hypothetical protein LTS16_008599 [Friedmanniomyces endolithicus]